MALPPRNLPESVTSFIASSAEAAMPGVSDSIGPVKPKIIPTLTSSPAWAAGAIPKPVAATNATAAAALRILFENFMTLKSPMLFLGLCIGADASPPPACLIYFPLLLLPSIVKHVAGNIQ